MIVPDVNLLLYAELDAFTQHDRARVWWESLLGGDRSVGLAPVSVFGFLRISTNRKVFSEPLAMTDAIERVESWLQQPCATFLVPGPLHLVTAFRLLKQIGTGGNLTTDVQLAAHAIEHGGELHSNDTDFARFEGLRWVNPIAG
jgi:toxin-antitoxin system PIN domain toxin